MRVKGGVRVRSGSEERGVMRDSTHMGGDLQRRCLLSLLLALQVHHQRRVHGGLYLVVNADHTSLAIDGRETIEV